MLPEAGFVSSHLDKLNVYTEGGFFKPHVDTPRQGAAQFGTLIVCLPVGFEGGELVVSHGGRTVEYAWGEGAAEGEVQWAAVYSDCRHEVLPVRAGARVTLTYDLVGDLLLERRLN
jgi:predicted 2-oxoglutarate/Fe(II)-dependent dioxygenase YbiX